MTEDTETGITLIPAMTGGRVKAISFDGDMTMWDFEKVMRHALAVVLNLLRGRVPGRSTEELTVDMMVRIRDEVAAGLKGTAVDLREIRLRGFQKTLEVAGCPDETLARELTALYRKHRYEDVDLYPDAVFCLERLRAHYVLGLLSNGMGFPDRCWLSEHFRFVVFAPDVGVEKPDPAIFQAACREAGCEPAELVHIGDSLEDDVAGANRVGAVSVWLNRHGRENRTGIVPDYEVRSLTEFARVMGAGPVTSDGGALRMTP